MKLSLPKKWIIILILLFAILASGGVWLCMRALKRTENTKIKDLLAEADYALSLGYTARSEEFLDRAMNVASSEYNLLSILNRVYKITKLNKNNNILEKYSHAAVKKIPGSKKLCSIAAYSSLRTGHPEDVLKIIKSMPKDENMQYLLAEAYIQTGKEISDDEKFGSGIKRLISLQKAEDPEQLRILWTGIGDSRILLNASLLLMKRGNPSMAYTVLEKDQAFTFYEPKAYIAYDAGLYDESIRLIEHLLQGEERIDLIMLYADILRITERFKEAKKQYLRVIADDPHFSRIPYLNLAWILEKEGDTDTALFYREKAYSQFQETNDFRKKLLLLDNISSQLQYRAALWKLFNLYPENEKLCERLVLFLLEYGELKKAVDVIDRFIKNVPEKSFSLYWIQGIIEALQCNYEKASQLLQESLKQKQDWRNCYNHGIVLEADGRHKDAVEELMKAENLLKKSKDDLIHFISLIRTKLAEIYLFEQNYMAAKRESEYAIELDSSNIRARLILKKLEEYQKK